MPEGRAGRDRPAACLSQGKAPKTRSFRPPVTSILTRFRWSRSSTRRPAVLIRAGAGRCHVQLGARHADEDLGSPADAALIDEAMMWVAVDIRGRQTSAEPQIACCSVGIGGGGVGVDEGAGPLRYHVGQVRSAPRAIRWASVRLRGRCPVRRRLKDALAMLWRFDDRPARYPPAGRSATPGDSREGRSRHRERYG